MKLLDKILVNVDLENVSNEHLKVAEKLADKFNSEIILLCVLPREANVESLKNHIKSYANGQLDSIIAQTTYPKDKIEKRIEYGNMFEKIISVSDLENVNLVINFVNKDKLVVNSEIDVLSEKLVRKSAKPVMIIKPGKNIVDNDILCPVDFSESSERALNNAIKIARLFSSKLSVLNVFEPMKESFTKRLDIDFSEENSKLQANNKKQLDEFLSKFNFVDVDYSVIQLAGEPYEILTDYILKNQIDFVFIGATGKNFIQRHILGSVTDRLIRSTTASMVVMKAENLLELKIESDISTIEKHLEQAAKLEEAGYYKEAIAQLKACLLINDLHLPVLNRLSKLYEKTGDKKLAESYEKSFNEVLRRLWDRKIESEISRGLRF